MGLLDDAIREHLELKRLRGADPGLVAREEREAFGPVRGGEATSTDDDSADSGASTDAGDLSPEDDPGQTSRPDCAQGFSNVGQETAELDMRTVLEEDSDRDVATVGPVAVGPAKGRSSTEDASPEQVSADDSLEWEMPGDGAPADVSRHAESSDRRGDADDLGIGGSMDQQEEHVDDVLEETPDFLRDTPEQERLWFEQRPPRDFDFDK